MNSSHSQMMHLYEINGRYGPPLSMNEILLFARIGNKWSFVGNMYLLKFGQMAF